VPKPTVFGVDSSTRCIICLDKEISEWVRKSLEETLNQNFPRPSISRVHKETIRVFGDRSPRHEGSMNRHLVYHTPEWRGWDDEDA
jgi:hypothetical protein